MVFDFHTHLYPGLEDEMKRAKVDKAVVLMPFKRSLYTPKGRISYATKEEILDGNETVISASSDKLIPFAWLNYKIPESDKKLHDYVQRGCKGLKLHPVVDNYSLQSPMLEPLIETAADLGIPIMIHTGWRPKGSVEDVGRLAKKYPDAKFVAAHMKEEYGVNKRLSHIRVASQNDNVWLETSYAEHPRRIAEAVKQIGSERLLFGSDYPFGSTDISWDMTKITCANISDKDKRKILQENALDLLNKRKS